MTLLIVFHVRLYTSLLQFFGRRIMVVGVRKSQFSLSKSVPWYFFEDINALYDAGYKAHAQQTPRPFLALKESTFGTYMTRVSKATTLGYFYLKKLKQLELERLAGIKSDLSTYVLDFHQLKKMEK